MQLLQCWVVSLTFQCKSIYVFFFVPVTLINDTASSMNGRGNSAKRKWKIKIMIGLSNRFYCERFFDDADSQSHAIEQESNKKQPPLQPFLKDFMSGECLRWFHLNHQIFSFFSHLRCIFNWQPVDFVSSGKNVVTVENPLANENYTFLQPTRLNTPTLFHITLSCIICAMSSVVNFSCSLKCLRTVIL